MCYQGILDNDFDIFTLNVLLGMFSLKDFVDVATVLAGIAAAVSSYLGFQALVEVRKQREATYAPELVLSGGKFYVYNIKLDKLVFPSAIPWEYSYRAKRPNYTAVNTGKIVPLPINIHNIGLGAAKNVTITCETNIDEWLEIFNKISADVKGELPFTFTSTMQGTILLFKSADYIGLGSRSLNIKQTTQTMNHILPASIENKSYNLHMPNIIFYFISALTYLQFYRHSSGNPSAYSVPKPLPNIRINVTYLDIANKKIDKNYVANIDSIANSVGFSTGSVRTLTIVETNQKQD